MKNNINEILKYINESITHNTPVPVSKIFYFIKEVESQRKIISEAATILMDHGFGPDDDDAQFDIIAMIKSAITDLKELKDENIRLKAQIRDSKIFEETLKEN